VDQAVAIVAAKTCECRVWTGRHHMTRSILEQLADRGRVSWSEACDRARKTAREGGHTAAYGTKYLRRTESPSHIRGHAQWTQGYIASGAPRGERFTRGPVQVRTKLDLDGSEPVFTLA
jgi:hypothetical protein